MRLYDNKRKVIVDVADNLVNDALKSGNYDLRPGVEVPIVLPDGTRGTLSSDEMPKAIQMGVRYRTADEDKQYAAEQTKAIRQEALDRPGLAAVTGALRGGTLGISDVALRGAGELIGQGDVVAEQLRGLQEVNPKASMAGEIAGGIASFVTPAGSLGVATRVLGAPVRGITKAGEQIAARSVAAGKAFNELNAAQKIGRAVVGGAVEGAAIGAGQTLSELALSDPDLTLQKALTNVTLGAVLGGGLSGTARGAFEGVKAGSIAGLEALSKSDLVPKSAKALAGRISEVYGTASKIARADLQLGPEWDKLWDRGNAKFREDILEASANPRALVEGVAKQFDDVKNFGQELSDVASQGAKIQGQILDSQTGRVPKQVLKQLDDDTAEEFGIDAILENRVIKGPSLVQAEKEAGYATFDRIQQTGRNLVTKGDELLTKMRTANETERSFGRSPMYDDATIRDLASRIEGFSTSVASASKPSEIASAMTQFKNELAPLFKISKRKTLDDIKSENRPLWETIGELRNYWKAVKETTTSKEVFGELGSAMATRADVISQVMRYTDDLMGRFYRIKQGATMNQREYVPDLAKIKSYIVSPDAERNAVRTEAINEMRDRVKEAIDKLSPINLKDSQAELTRLQKTLAKVERIPANKKGAATKDEKIKFLQSRINPLEQQIKDGEAFNANIDKFRANALKRVESFEKSFDVAVDKRMALLLLNAIESSTGRSLMGGLVGASAGGFGQELFGSEGRAMGSFFGGLGGLILTNPKTAMRYISAMENAASGFDKMAKNAATRFANFDKSLAIKKGLTTKAVPAVRQSIIRDRLKIEPGERAQETDEKAFKEHRKKLGAITQDPAALFERIAAQIGDEGLQEAPRLAIDTYSTVQRAMAFLESKIPKDPYPPDAFSSDNFLPSKVELAQYGDYVEAVMKPKVILKQMEQGDINPRTVEAIRAVYPRMYQDLLAKVTETLAEKGNKVAYDQRVQLGLLFDIPSTKAMQPDYLARMIMYYGGQQQETQTQTQQPMNRTQMVGFREMKVSEREQRV